jgi:branched-chain amino acid transport system ATP-binding protein
MLNLSKGLAYLPQTNAVFDDLTVQDNLRFAGHTIHDREDFAARRDEVLSSLPALRPLLRRKPEKMSGGERQMLALAMVLLHRPSLLLLDEPTAGLSVENFQVIIGVLRQLVGSSSTRTLLLVGAPKERARENAAGATERRG